MDTPGGKGAEEQVREQDSCSAVAEGLHQCRVVNNVGPASEVAKSAADFAGLGKYDSPVRCSPSNTLTLDQAFGQLLSFVSFLRGRFPHPQPERADYSEVRPPRSASTHAKQRLTGSKPTPRNTLPKPER